MTEAISEQPVLIHIGFHKTGTSFLQQRFFVSQFGFSRWPSDQTAIHPAMIDLGPFEDLSEKTLAMLRSEVDQAGDRHCQWVLSHERLAGHPSSGGYDARLLADRVRSAFPHARVFMGIREQDSVIRSIYSQFVTEGGSLSLRKYLSDPQKPLRKMPVFRFDYYRYANAIRYYQRIFGADRVLVLPYEMFVKTPLEFLNRIGQFARPDDWDRITSDDIDTAQVNAARTVLMQSFRRLLNATLARTQFSNSGLINLPLIVKAYSRISARAEFLVPRPLDDWMKRRQRACIRDLVGDYYHSDNVAVEELTGIDLSGFGYRTSQKPGPSPTS